MGSGAQTEGVDDVLAVMRSGGAILCSVDDVAVGSARYTLDDSDEMYVGRGPDRVWTMIKHV